MADVVLEPRFYDLSFFREQYEALQDEMREAGLHVHLEREMERRSAGSGALQTAWDVAITVKDAAEMGLIIALLLKHLTGRAKMGPNRGERRKVVIFGPDRRVLREVELPDDG